MGYAYPIVGPPGAQSPSRVTFRRIFEGAGAYLQLPGGKFIDGSISLDPNNTYAYNLEAGLLMGLENSNGPNQGFMAPSVIGQTTVAQLPGDTTITLSPSSAAYLVYRCGAAGYFTLTGCGSATNTLAAQNAATTVTTCGVTTGTLPVAYTSVNVTTGVVTLTAALDTYTSGTNQGMQAGAFVGAGTGAAIGNHDGTYTPLSFIPDGSGITVVNQDTLLPVTAVQWPNVPIAGVICTPYSSGPGVNSIPSPGSQGSDGLLNWPGNSTAANIALTAWLISQLSTANGGKFIFSSFFAQ